jgi:nitrite reductase (NADH) large subunit
LEAVGVRTHLGTKANAVLGEARVRGVRLGDGERLDTDMVIIAAGTTPRDELARAARLAVAKAGGIVVNDRMQTSDPHIYAVGECVAHRGTRYGLTGPGQEMASVVVANLTGADTRFTGARQATRTRLGDIEVASLGDPLADAELHRSILYEDHVKGIYKKLVLSRDGKRLLGGILLGDASRYPMLLELMNNDQDLPVEPERLLFGYSSISQLSSLAETG